MWNNYDDSKLTGLNGAFKPAGQSMIKLPANVYQRGGTRTTGKVVFFRSMTFKPVYRFGASHERMNIRNSGLIRTFDSELVPSAIAMSHKIKHITTLHIPFTSMDTHKELHKMAAQLHPLQINAKTGEPYLALPAPHSNIIITPFRLNSEDEKFNIEYLNNIEVVKWLSGPPFPYEQTHARQWIEKTFADSQKLLEEIYRKPPGFLIDGCPVSILREIQEDGRDILIGDCSIKPWIFEEIFVPEDNQKARTENEARAAGDALKEWAFGDYLAPSHHGKGIMSLAIKTLIEQWVIPRMGANIIKVSVFTHNIASRRVFEKNGFVLWKTVENCRPIPESKGGGVFRTHILKLDKDKDRRDTA